MNKIEHVLALWDREENSHTHHCPKKQRPRAARTRTVNQSYQCFDQYVYDLQNTTDQCCNRKSKFEQRRRAPGGAEEDESHDKKSTKHGQEPQING